MITEKIFNAENVTAISPQLAQLKQLFPNCFNASGEFLFEKFQAEIVLQTDISKEFYSMNWLGKSYAKLLRNLPPETLLTEDLEHNCKPENADSQNVLIQGDNLEVLQHLRNAYPNSVKMIYIDPPYNTGSDGFVYQDDRKFTPEQLANLANITQDEADRILNFTDKGSNAHSAWLTFMYPRLYIARELLKEDGVIFISIDDNEAAQLKLLCDEVFGEGNFVGQVSRATGTPTGGGGSSPLVNELDYLLIYSKTNNISFSGIEMTEDEAKIYDKEDEKGKYLIRPLRRTGGEDRREDRPTMYFPLTAPDGEIIYPIAPTGYESRWICGEPKFIELNNADLIEWKKDKNNNWVVYQKFYLEGRLKQVGNLWTKIDGNKKATREVRDLFDSKKVFSFPKPIGFVKQCLQMVTEPNDLILDFFAGSGTTAHAVMQLNAEDGGNRQFILVQLPEQTDSKSEAYKAGYKTIFEITKARIEKSAVKIREENPNASGAKNIDSGFKIYQTTENFNAVSDDEFNPNQAQLPNLTSLTESQIQTLLTTWRVYDGAKLTAPVQAVDLDGYTAYLCDKRLYLLNEYFNSQHLLAFIHKLDDDTAFNPNRVIVFGSHMASAMQQELNQALASYSNRKNINLSLIIRN